MVRVVGTVYSMRQISWTLVCPSKSEILIFIDLKWFIINSNNPWLVVSITDWKSKKYSRISAIFVINESNNNS
jgi:hypothetical protein